MDSMGGRVDGWMGDGWIDKWVDGGPLRRTYKVTRIVYFVVIDL